MIDASNITDDGLQTYDTMMIEAVLKLDRFSPLAHAIWAEVLRELDLRGKVKLISGSYENVGDSKIKRLY
jgi:hypothetical protein